MISFIKDLLKRYIKDSQYKKNILIMVIGRVFAQAIPVLLTPLLTRIYTPENFGIFGVFSTIISIIAMLSTGRYCLAIILPKKDEKAISLFSISSLLTVITAIIITILLLIWGDVFFDLLNTPVLDKYIWMVVMNMLFMGLYESLYYYALRMKAFKILTTNIIVQSLVLISSRLIFGYLGYTEFGLLLSYLLGYAISYVLMLFRLNIQVGEIFKNLKWSEQKELMKRYHKFPKYSLAADTLSMTSNMAPNIFINKIFGTAVNGYYNMTDKILGSPIWLVTSSVGDVFRQEASEQFRTKGSCFVVFKKTVRAMFFWGLVPFLLLFIFAPYFITPLLGDGWSEVGNMLRVFSILYFIKFIVRPVYPVLYIVRKQDYNAIFQGLHLLSVIIGFVVGILTGDLYLCLILWSVLASLSYLIILYFSYKFAKNTTYNKNEEE